MAKLYNDFMHCVGIAVYLVLLFWLSFVCFGLVDMVGVAWWSPGVISGCIILADFLAQELVLKLAIPPEGKTSLLTKIAGRSYQFCKDWICFMMAKLYDGLAHGLSCTSPIVASLYDELVSYFRIAVYLVVLLSTSSVCFGLIDKVFVWVHLGSAWVGATWCSPAVLSACIVLADIFAQLLLLKLTSGLDLGPWKKSVDSAKPILSSSLSKTTFYCEC